jgi:hypothetical protein
LAGGALVAAANAMTERRRWRREREATAEERQLEVRQATRLIEQELVEAEHLIIAAAKAKEYRRARRAPTATWNEWRPYLARHLGVADWRLVTMAFDAINDLNWLLDNREAEGRVRLVVRDDDQLKQRLYAVRTAAHILRLEVDEGEKVDRWLKEGQALDADLFGADPAAPG